jgi:hypothetical protein
MADTVNSTALREGRTASQRDPSKPWNQLHPLSQRDGGTNLDEVCGSIEQSEAGLGLDRAVSRLEKGGK